MLTKISSLLNLRLMPKVFLPFSKIILILLALLFLPYLAFAYEDQTEKRLNLWPFFVYSKHKPKNLTRIELLGPFISKTLSPKEESFSLRPIYSSVKEIEDNRTIEKRTYIISPFGLYRENEEEIRFKLIPLIDKSIKKDASENEGQKWDFFPFFAGKTASNETYGGVFPIYGTYKERFGAKEISFFLWPLYSRVSYDNYTAHNIIWPFIRVAKPTNHIDKTYRGFKFWPFYGHFKEGEEERKFILWPFYIIYDYQDDTGNFVKRRYFFPFYMKEDTETYEKRIYLWPFFQKVCGVDPPYYQFDAPWPFYRKIKGEDIEGKRYWPIYGYVSKSDSKEFFILWPFYFYREDWYNSTKSSTVENEARFLLFSKFYEEKTNGTLTKSEFRRWPLYYSYHQYISPKQEAFYLPAILPFFDEGMERNYGSLLKLYEVYSTEDYTFSKALFGFYRHERFGRRNVVELAFLLRYVDDEHTHYVEFLEGLIGWGLIDGKNIFKILYIPIQLTPQSPTTEGN
jgi:hypothetical protein